MAPPRSRIGREPSALRLQGVPLLSTMLASLTPIIPAIFAAPVMPPFGLLFLLAWRMLHRTLWPVWMALPLGLFDDLFSGNVLGSSMLLWPLSFLFLEFVDRRMMWRDFWQEWAIASVLVVATLSAQLLISWTMGGGTPILLLLPQFLLSILAFPLVARICDSLDRWRLAP